MSLVWSRWGIGCCCTPSGSCSVRVCFSADCGAIPSYVGVTGPNVTAYIANCSGLLSPPSNCLDSGNIISNVVNSIPFSGISCYTFTPISGNHFDQYSRIILTDENGGIASDIDSINWIDPYCSGNNTGARIVPNGWFPSSPCFTQGITGVYHYTNNLWEQVIDCSDNFSDFNNEDSEVEYTATSWDFNVNRFDPVHNGWYSDMQMLYSTILLTHDLSLCTISPGNCFCVAQVQYGYIGAGSLILSTDPNCFTSSFIYSLLGGELFIGCDCNDQAEAFLSSLPNTMTVSGILTDHIFDAFSSDNSQFNPKTILPDVIASSVFIGANCPKEFRFKNYLFPLAGAAPNFCPPLPVPQGISSLTVNL